MKVTFKTGSEANYGSTNGELFFASNTKQIMLNGIKYIPKKLSELTNDSGFITSITKSMVEGVLTGNITSHTHTFASLESKPTTLSGYGITDAMYFYTYNSYKYVAARFIDSTLATKAANTYIELWQSDRWFNLKAGKFITNGGTSSQFLKGDGSLDSNTYALSSALNNYLPLAGGTLTGNLTCNGSYITMSGGAGAKGYSGYFNNPKRSDRASYSHILGDGYAYGTNSISIGAGAYAGIRNTDSDSDTYPYLRWQWMDCLQVKEVTSAGDVNCYGAILNNLGGTKDTAKFTVCVDGVCKFYDESKGDNDPTNQFLKFTNTDANCGRVVVFIVDNDATYNKGLIFGGTTEHPRRMCNLKIGNMILGQGSQVTDVASTTINKKTVYRLAIYWWDKKLSTLYDITKATTAMVCTKVNNSNYNGASSYASGYYSVASGAYSVASGAYSVASGYYSVASGYYSVASGAYSVASGAYSVASGAYSVASGYYSVASGYYSVASGAYSVAKHEGSKVYALRGISGANYQIVLGRDNVETSGAVVVGWGSSDTSRKNIFVLDTNGNATFGSGGAGTVTAATFNGDTINVGTINVAEQLTTKNITIGNHLSISSGADISGLTPSMIGAAEALHTHSYIVTEGDNRSVATTPNDYSNKFTFKGLKYNSDIGSPTNDTYSYILGLRGWSDSSGGQSHELAFNNSGVYRRQGATTEWGDWYKILDSGNYNSYAATKDHTHTFASLESKPTTLSGYGIADAYTKTETDTELGKYLPLTGGTLNGALTVPKLTSTGGIVLGIESINGSLGIKKYNNTGFIGFSDISGGINGSAPFAGISLGWGSSPETSANSVRINENTFTYKGKSVLHSGNLGYTSSGLSRAVQKDASGNLFIVAPSLFEQGISNNYPKNLRWSNETEGQLVYDTEIEAGNFDTVEIGIPLADGTSKGFLKSTSSVTNLTGYTPCPVVSGTPYYKEDCLYLGSTEIGYTGIMEYGIQYTFNYGTKLPYLEDYTPDSIPRCVVLCFPDRSSNYRFLFWLSAFDEGAPYIARFYNSAYETWLTIDTASRQIILSYGNTWQS